MQWQRIVGACLCVAMLAVAGCGGGEQKQAEAGLCKRFWGLMQGAFSYKNLMMR